MLKKQRHGIIIKFVDRNQFAKVEELSQYVGISEITIRRDIIELDRNGSLKKVHGGASSLLNSNFNRSKRIENRNKEYTVIKDAIGKRASEFVRDNATIYLDAGSTVGRMIPYLRDKNIIVYTHGLHHIQDLVNNGIECYAIGGNVKPDTSIAIGPLSMRIILSLQFDQAFIGFNAFDETFGFSTPDEMEALTKNSIVRSTKEVFFLGDKSKFNKKSLVKFATPFDGRTITDFDNSKVLEKVDIVKV